MERGRVLWSPWLDSSRRSESPPSTSSSRARREHRRDRRGTAGRPLLRPRRHHAGRGRGARGVPRGHRDRAVARRDPPPGAHRGVRLNDLLGKRFRVGEVEAVGAEWCEPCNHIEKLTYDGVLKGMVHRAGLRPTSCSPAASRSATRSTRSQTPPHEQVPAPGRVGPALEAERLVERQRRAGWPRSRRARCARSRAHAPARARPPQRPAEAGAARRLLHETSSSQQSSLPVQTAKR